MNQTSKRRLEEIDQQVNMLRDKNDRLKLKHDEISSKHLEDAESHYVSCLMKASSKDKATKAIQKRMKEELDKKIETKQGKMETMANLKKEEMYKQREQAYELKQRFEKSAKVVEEYKKQ